MTTLVLMLHGVGSNGADLASLVPYFQPVVPDGVFASPDAPNAFGNGGNGRQWFSVAGITDANRPARVVAARAGLDAIIDAGVAQTKAGRVILIGFSQRDHGAGCFGSWQGDRGGRFRRKIGL